MTDKEMLAFARQALGLPDTASLEIAPLGARGSDRTYFRLVWPGQSAVLVHYDPRRTENAYQADIAHFLTTIGVPAPRIVAHDPAACLIVMEDLGGADLWSLRAEGWSVRRALYGRTLRIVYTLHSYPEQQAASSLKFMEPFGPELYRWEQDYFRDHFVKGLCGIELEDTAEAALEQELSRLATRLMQTPRCLVHRDLQSQNVMIRDGEPVLIDFQGMRVGSAFYDLGSLLCDPYIGFTDIEREELLKFYYGLSAPAMTWPAFEACFWEASAQRLMQALGAYGFLGLSRGLRHFLDHIPAGLANLLGVTARVGSLPALHALCLKCRAALKNP
jgi:aminoglycoside/choline kinase family phosphotransferase